MATSDGPSTSELDAVVDEYFRRVDAGEQLDQAAFLAQHAEVAPALKSFFANESFIRRIKSSTPPSGDTANQESLPTIPPASLSAAALTGPTSALKFPSQFGRYRIDKELGCGAMGAVYLAHDTELNRPVALKVPKFSGQETPDLIARFVREAQSAAVLGHPNICRVYDVSEHQGVRYIAMEYIDGKPLSAFIAAGNIQPKQAAIVIRKLAQGLAEAHERGIIHRDLKPDNILVKKNGEPVLTDFGLARGNNPGGQATATQDGMILGSPAYMPPEQAAGHLSEMGPTSDIYSLGVVLYELLTGELPFRGSIVEVLASVLTKTPKSVRDVKPDANPGLASICDKMMAKKPANRYQSMNDVVAALAEWAKSPQAAVTSSAKPAAGLATTGEFTLGEPHVVQPKQPSAKAQATISPTSAKAPKPADGVGGTEKVPERTPQQLKELGALVDQLLARNDYLEAIPILEQIPDYQRTPKLRQLLGEAFELKATVEKLERNLEKHLNLLDIPELKKCIDRLLKIHPSHPRGKEIRKALNTEGKKGVIKILKDEGNYHGGGLAWEPWQIGAALGTVAMIFAAVSYAVFVYIRGATGVLEIKIDDPTAVVKIEGKTATINSEGTGEIRIAYGDVDYTVEQGGTTIIANGKFEFQKGSTRVLTINLKDQKPVDGIAGTSPATPQTTESTPALAIAPFNAAQAKAHQEAWAKHLGVPVEYTNSLGMKFRLVPPGEFLMGIPDEEFDTLNAERNKLGAGLERFEQLLKTEVPQHKVRLTKPLFVGVHEVTQTQFTQIMGKNPSHFAETGEGKDKVDKLDTKTFPVESMTWNEAAEFCVKLSQKENLTAAYQDEQGTFAPAAGTRYRLPTEAEWEFSTRAGTNTAFWTGDSYREVLTAGWWSQNSSSRSHPVGELRANPFGLFDVHGNVFEFVQDGFDFEAYRKNASPSPAVDPTGPNPPGLDRVFRGGNWRDGPYFGRSSARLGYRANERGSNIGFRVVLPVDAVKAAPRTAQAADWKSGFLCLIYDGIEFNTLRKTRVDQFVNFNFGDKGAEPGSPADNFSVRWLGAVQVAEAGLHTVRMEHDDGALLWIDDQPVFTSWAGGITHDQTEVQLTKGWHTVRIEYREESATAGINFQWALKGQPLKLIEGDIVRHDTAWAKRTDYTNLGTPDGPVSTSALFPETEDCLVLSGHTSDVYGVAVHPDGQHVISAGWDGTARGWDVTTGQQMLNVSLGQATNCFCIAFSPDGQRFAVGGTKGEINVYEFPSGELVHSFDGKEKMIQAVVFTTDNDSLFSGSVDTSLLWWNVKNGKPLKSFQGNGSGVTSLAVTPDGKEVLSGGGDGIIRVGNLKTAKLRTQFTGHSGPALGLAVSLDGNYYASAGVDKTVRVQKLTGKATEKDALVLTGHTESAASVAFLPDGKRVVSGGFDKQVILWNLETGQPEKQWKAHRTSKLGVRSLAVSPKGDFIVTGGFDAKVRVWKTPLKEDASADATVPEATMDEVRDGLRELIQAGGQAAVTAGGVDLVCAKLDQVPSGDFTIRAIVLLAAVDDAGLSRLAPKLITKPVVATCVEFQGQSPQLTSASLPMIGRLQNLQVVTLKASGVTDAGFEHLARLSKLTGLHLDGTAATGTGFQHLQLLPELTRVGMGETALNAAGMKAICELPHLTHANLYGDQLTDAGLKFLPRATKLQELILAGCRQVTQQAAAESLRQMSSLSLLQVNGLQYNDGLFPALSDLKQLTHLILVTPNVTGQRSDLLARLPQLKRLQFIQCDFSDDSFAKLAMLKQITNLQIDQNKQPLGKGLRAFQPDGALTDVLFAQSRVFKEDLDAMKAALPKVNVTVSNPEMILTK